MGKSPRELYEEREKRVNDAVQLKVPDRVPFVPYTHSFPAKYTGMTLEEAFYDSAKWFAANEKVNIDLEPDLFWTQTANVPGQVLEILDSQQIKWPGHGVPANHTFQFVEREYMKADEYDAFLDDPSDFAIRTYLPRINGSLQALARLPSLKSAIGAYAGGSVVLALADPEIAGAFEALHRAGLEWAPWATAYTAFRERMEELGFPGFAGVSAVVPFDIISDHLRGMRGTMLDMYRQPDKLVEATESLYPRVLDAAVTTARRRRNPRVFIPLHRGADGFMSPKQFEKFYWPTTRRLILDLIAEGLTPLPFFEGRYDSRLDYLAELPPAKIIGMFDRTDVFKAKEVLGGVMCIAGNMPVSLLQTGTPEQVKDYSKRLIDVVGADGGFIMTCCTAMDEADPGLVRVWADFTKQYGVYR